jgi:6,7-dimethyl-8-ribityllumazine synthase
MATFEGDFSPPDGRFAIVVARFNALVTESLLRGCRDAFERHGVPGDRLDVAWVPGSFEVPLVARKMAEGGRYRALVCLGCIIRGETGHYDHVAGQAAAGVLQAGMATGVPVIFGILTTETVEQALNRAGLKAGNKGAEAAASAIEMVNLLAQVGREATADPSSSPSPAPARSRSPIEWDAARPLPSTG